MGPIDEERARPDAAGRIRLRTVLVIVAAVGGVGYAAGVVGAVAGNDRGPAILIIAAVPVALAIVLALLLHRFAARRVQSPLIGADRQAVRRAWRTGSTDDPLVQDPRASSARSDTVLVWLFGATAAAQAGAFVVVERPWGRAMAGLACVASLAAATLFWFQRRRVRRP
jgi:hypothetical protein